MMNVKSAFSTLRCERGIFCEIDEINVRNCWAIYLRTSGENLLDLATAIGAMET
jgi:hypothetical protein